MKKPVIFTIGHSTHPIDEFKALLNAHGIQEIADVRTITRSRHNPQFNEFDLRESLEKSNILYSHIKELGGLRHAKKDSINLGWHNTSFRGYADYMASPEFEEGLEALAEIANVRNTAIMCAEAVPWRCHRSLIADALTKQGWLVRDIMSLGSAPAHRLTPFLKVRRGQIIYPAPET
ncbi:MAG: DUF488 domain-containing protein [Devosia sp.]|nr:DUF488 domain-containing protein [Devosia sp.]